ncbi:MAG: DNA translocase FtsK 4TM domain-containing protein, partial [Thermomicrobium sp.]
MAQARTRGRQRSAASKQGAHSVVSNVLRHLARISHGIVMGIPRRLPRDLAALFLATVGVLVALALLGQANKTGLVGWLANGCHQLFGRGALLVPFTLWWGALEIALSSSRQATVRRAIGLGLYAAGALALLDARATNRVEEAGGYLGAGIATLLRLIGGEVGLGLLALALGLAGSTLIAGADLRTLVARGVALGRVLSGHLTRHRRGPDTSSVREPDTAAPGHRMQDMTKREPEPALITPPRHTSTSRVRSKRGIADGRPRAEQP